MRRKNRYSARVGMLGPGTAANTPGKHGTPTPIAVSRASSRHGLEYASLMSGHEVIGFADAVSALRRASHALSRNVNERLVLEDLLMSLPTIRRS